MDTVDKSQMISLVDLLRSEREAAMNNTHQRSEWNIVMLTNSENEQFENANLMRKANNIIEKKYYTVKTKHINWIGKRLIIFFPLKVYQSLL